MTISELNRLSPAEFVSNFGNVFERSPWVAQRVERERPLAGVDALHAKMVQVVESAPREEQLALLRAHPELAGREAQTGDMTASSVAEQASAGLNALTRAELDRMAQLNAAYRARFGFPFIIAVRNYSKEQIFAEMERRSANDPDAELRAALRQVYAITRMRLDAMVAS